MRNHQVHYIAIWFKEFMKPYSLGKMVIAFVNGDSNYSLYIPLHNL